MGKFKVGDKVRIVNDGAEFTTYESWVEKFAPEYLDEYIGSMWALDGDTGEIIAMGEHESFKKYGILYLIKSPNKIILIGERGIELIEKGEDKMELQFEDLKTGMIIETENNKYMFFKKVSIYNGFNESDNMLVNLKDGRNRRFNIENFENKRFMSYNEWDRILKIGFPEYLGDVIVRKNMSINKVLWERPSTKKLTVGEIEKLLGYPVEIIKEDK